MATFVVLIWVLAQTERGEEDEGLGVLASAALRSFKSILMYD